MKRANGGCGEGGKGQDGKGFKKGRELSEKAKGGRNMREPSNISRDREYISSAGDFKSRIYSHEVR